MSRRVWLLSAYRSASHGAWADWLLASFPAFDWQCLELPGRHFRWRIRGNPLSWLDTLPDHTPDLIIATSMVDLATLRGLHPRLVAVPTIYYFHENQFAYPRSQQQVASVEPQIVQLYGALCADRLVFNSAFNRDSFLQGVDDLLVRMPDAVPEGVRERLAPHCEVLPVPVTAIPPARERDPRLILWNHRWEYDKAPEVFAEALARLAAGGTEFRLALLGPRPRQAPPVLASIREQFGGRIVVDAEASHDEYCHWLGRAGVVVGTAIHEFQGLALLEAASAGVRPLVPDALCYPEQYPAACRYTPGDSAALAEHLAAWLDGDLPPPVDVSAWTDLTLRQRWGKLLGP